MQYKNFQFFEIKDELKYFNLNIYNELFRGNSSYDFPYRRYNNIYYIKDCYFLHEVTLIWKKSTHDTELF